MSCEACSHLTDIEDLSSPYVVKTCQKCSRKINLRPQAVKGQGIKVEKGDQFIIPQGWIKFSANPLKARGVLTRSGLEWFAKLIFLGDLSKKLDDIDSELKKNEDFCDNYLQKSDIIKDFDISNPEHSEQIFQRLNSNQSSSEWWAYLFGLFNSVAKDAIEENNAKKAAWAMGNAERCRSMLVFKDNLEEVVWMGNSARRIIDAGGFGVRHK